MILCSCNVLSDTDVRKTLGVRADRPSVGALFRHMGCEAKCGRCVRNIVALVDQHAASGLDDCGGSGECDSCRANDIAA